MKRVSDLRVNPGIVSFAVFQIAFFTFMWVSKTVHLLYFEANGAVDHFGASYSAMALAGYFSFFVGHFSDVFGHRRMLAIGGVLYAIGLGLRIFPQSLSLAIASGLISGVGASAVLSALRVWMVSLVVKTPELDTTARLVGVKSSTMALGMGLGCILAGSLPLFTLVTVDLRDLLLVSSIGTLILAIAAFFMTRDAQVTARAETGPAKKPWAGFIHLLRSDRRLVIATSLIGITTGFYVSFISPYLPLIMKDKGFDLLSIGLSTGSFAILRFLVDPWIAKFVGRHQGKNLQVYLAAELLVALVTGGFLLTISKWAFVLLLLMRSCALGLSAISEETLWLKIFPRHALGLFFGLNQSAFFLGDFLGGLMNGLMYERFGLDVCIQIVLVIMILNAALFVFFSVENSASKVMSPAESLRELRRIWCHDQYRPIAISSDGHRHYFTHSSGESYRLYAFDRTGRKLVQRLSADRDWCWDPTGERFTERESVDDTPEFRREEHVVDGYRVLFGDTLMPDLPRRQIESFADVTLKESVLMTGARVLWLTPARCRRWVVSLHGGPESCESTEIRYGGLYRSLLRRGIGVAILNYVGSAMGEPSLRKKAWGRWGDSIVEDFRALSVAGKSRGFRANEAVAFGVSFGGALALHPRTCGEVPRAIVASPLLDLSTQVHRAGDEFRSWFDERFGEKDHVDFSFDALTRAKTEVSAYLGNRDEVLGTDHLSKLSKVCPRWSVEVANQGHVARSYRETAAQRIWLEGAFGRTSL